MPNNPPAFPREIAPNGVEIWARFDEQPAFDALLVTVHYNYGFMDNSQKRVVAAAIVKLLGGTDRD